MDVRKPRYSLVIQSIFRQRGSAVIAAKRIDTAALEELYARFNKRAFVHPDPLEFLYNYEDPADAEVAGLVASALAYGRVKQILRSVGDVLSRMGPPRRFAMEKDLGEMEATFAGFKHRFTTGAEVAALSYGAGRLISRHGSLENAFLAHTSGGDETTVGALEAFAEELRVASGLESHLLPRPSAGSACKRLHLYLRWMVRSDEVDPGCWKGISPAKLVVPLDTHMHSICGGLGLTGRKQADIRTALEITESFRRFAPEDPVRYDFALTRLGIRHDEDPAHLFEQYSVREGD